MNYDNFLTLYNELLQRFRAGDEKGVSAFLAEHYQEFPKDIQEQITMLFFEEAMNNVAARGDSADEFKRDGIETIRFLETVQRQLDDKLKVKNLEGAL